MEKNKLRLTYFGARGSCDKVRLLLAIAGLNYQEVIVTGREFGRMSGEVEFGKLPLLEDGDLRLVHSCAIMRHLARKADLYGSDAREAALCDMWMEQCEEVQQALWKAEFITQDVSDFRAEAMKSQFLQDYLIPEFTHMSKLMAKNDTMFLVGNKLTFADIALFALLESVEREIPLAVASFPLLEFFHCSMKQAPRIKQFCGSGRRF